MDRDEKVDLAGCLGTCGKRGDEAVVVDQGDDRSTRMQGIDQIVGEIAVELEFGPPAGAGCAPRCLGVADVHRDPRDWRGAKGRRPPERGGEGQCREQSVHGPESSRFRSRLVGTGCDADWRYCGSAAAPLTPARRACSRIERAAAGFVARSRA